MKSIEKLFSQITNSKNISDYASEYKIHKINLRTQLTPGLSQGEKFKKYQRKLQKNLEKEINKVNSKEGLENMSSNGLTAQSNTIIKNNNFSSQEHTIDNLRNQYQTTLDEYGNLMAQISGSTTNYINRVNPHNPYLGKNIKFQNGTVAYVTKQGIVKVYPNNDIFINTTGKNGCPSRATIQISVRSPSALGSQIATNPPLKMGTPMVSGQSCGNEGQNVFVNMLTSDPASSYVGCYNNIPPSTTIKFVPKMNASNTVNGFTSSTSSTYLDNNDVFGPWHAFDQDPNTYWHSKTDAANLYNASTGVYTGSNGMNYKDADGNTVNVKGEYIAIDCGPGITLTKYDIQGRQGCCGNPNGRSPNSWVIIGNIYNVGYELVDKRDNQALNDEMRTYTVSNSKPYNGYIFLTTSCGNPGNHGQRYCVQISSWNLYTGSSPAGDPAMIDAGRMNFSQCQTYALNMGDRYFGLQNVDANGVGKCVISNDLAKSQMYGAGIKYTSIALWNSDTVGQGSSASLNDQGSLTVFNSSVAAIYGTPVEKTIPNYLGCYGDDGARKLPTLIGGGKTYDTCSAAAIAGNWSYFGLQDTQPNGTQECWVGNDLTRATSNGRASNCQIVNGVNVGGGWSNAVYDVKNPASKSYLYLQDDGNMCIYKGASPSDNQGGIWCSQTGGKKQQANPNFAASKGKYGQNWIGSGSTLAAGDFIGNTTGSIYLLMQTDGNLVLYTSTSAGVCSTFHGKNVGQQDVNALYQINQMGNKSNMGKVSYIDENSKLHAYPSTNIQYTNTYNKISGFDSVGNDIPGAAFGNTNINDSQEACTANPDCAGFVFNNSTKTFYPKNASMYPVGAIQSYKNLDVYARNKAPLNPPIGVTNKTNNIDTIFYQNYVSGAEVGNSYGLAHANSAQKARLEQLQSKMDQLADQIAKLTGKFGTGSQQADSQNISNSQGIQDYLKDINTTNNNVTDFDNNVDYMLKDSDIVVLQKNYDYLFWSILAIGTIVVSINIIKK